jgi:hypothetical protein
MSGEGMAGIAFSARCDRRVLSALVRRLFRRWLIGFPGCGELLIAAGTAVFLTSGDDLDAIGVGIGGGGIGAILVPLLIVDRAIRSAAPLAKWPMSFRFDDEGIHTSHGFSPGGLRWSDVVAVDVRSTCVLLRLKTARILPVPTRELSDATRTALLALLRTHGTAAAREAAGHGPAAATGPENDNGARAKRAAQH